MKVIGFNFSKISAERSQKSLDNVKINTKMNISSIEPLKSNLLNTNEDIINVEFNYSLNYEPELAKIELKGNIILSVEPKLAKEILKDWKDKKTSEDFRIPLLNIIFKKSSLKSLQLEEELALPSHLPMPSFKKGEKVETKEESKEQ